MARELTHARKLCLILGSLKSLPTIIIFGVDNVATAHALLKAYTCELFLLSLIK